MHANIAHLSEPMQVALQPCFIGHSVSNITEEQLSNKTDDRFQAIAGQSQVSKTGRKAETARNVGIWSESGQSDCEPK